MRRKRLSEVKGADRLAPEQKKGAPAPLPAAPARIDAGRAVAAYCAYCRAKCRGERGASLPARPTEAQLAALCGRVVLGRGEAQFRTLHRHGAERKPISWICGPDGLRMFLDLEPVDAFLKLGFSRKWIRKRMKDGDEFRLAVFPISEVSMYPSTWEGIFQFVESVFPEAYPKVKAVETELLRAKFQDIEDDCKAKGFLKGSTYFDVNEAGDADLRYINTPRFVSKDTRGTLGQVRGWLYFEIGLSDLFDGGGYTKRYDGSRGVKEYLMRNRRVQDFRDFQWVHISVGAHGDDGQSSGRDDADGAKASSFHQDAKRQTQETQRLHQQDKATTELPPSSPATAGQASSPSHRIDQVPPDFFDRCRNPGDAVMVDYAHVRGGPRIYLRLEYNSGRDESKTSNDPWTRPVPMPEVLARRGHGDPQFVVSCDGRKESPNGCYSCILVPEPGQETHPSWTFGWCHDRAWSQYPMGLFSVVAVDEKEREVAGWKKGMKMYAMFGGTARGRAHPDILHGRRTDWTAFQEPSTDKQTCSDT